MRRLMAGCVVMLSAWLPLAASAQVNALPPQRHILVYGEAQARAIPDRFSININVESTDMVAGNARNKVESLMRDTLRKLGEARVPAADIVATSLQIEPKNEYDQDQRKQVYRGMTVRRSLTARFASQESLKGFLAGLETSQDLQVSGVTTVLSEEAALKRGLRAKAIESTKQKAQTIAQSYGVKLGGLYSVSDTAPQFEYGIREGEWPALYQWNAASGSLDSITVTGSRGGPRAAPVVFNDPAPMESFNTGYVTFDDRIYAVFLLQD